MAALKTLSFVTVTLLVVVLVEKYILDYQSILVLLKGGDASTTSIIRQQNASAQSESSSDRIFTTERLALYDGTKGSKGPGKGLHVAFLGRVYNVSGKGDNFYKPGETYSFFAGRDATRAFITGDFSEEGLEDHVDGFTLVQLGEVMEWVEFYEKEYTRVGFLQGRYYTETGQPTEERLGIEDEFRQVVKMKAAQEEERNRYPYCDVDIIQVGKKVRMSCVKPRSVDNASNPAIRVPRKYYKPGAHGWRCACVPTKYLENNDKIGELEGCDLERECLFAGDFTGFFT